jgi:uncharacterized protein (TIGR00255 family)
MTGFGRAETETDGYKATVEIKSVNHRYLELAFRTPRTFGFLEDRLKSLISLCVSRGKTDVFVSVEETGELLCPAVTVNRSLAREYLDAIGGLSGEFGLSGEISAEILSRFPDVFTVSRKPADEEKVWPAVSGAVRLALEKFLDMREFEGEKLKADILSRCDAILEKVEVIEARSPQLALEYREKLEQRLRDLLGDVKVDEQRLITETAIMADKTAVAEETVRLRSHIAQMGAILFSGGAVGRKLDFLVQEFNRETNTIGSKIQNLEISGLVIDIKAEIEKIREQIQNIE